MACSSACTAATTVATAATHCDKRKKPWSTPAASLSTAHASISSGIRHDSTLGFAEREGFRCGTCHPYPLYDWQQQQESSVIEHPLIVMDGSLIEYRQLDPPTARAQIRRLHNQCMAVEGDMVILWHNHTTIREFEEYYRKVYLAFLQSL